MCKTHFYFLVCFFCYTHCTYAQSLDSAWYGDYFSRLKSPNNLVKNQAKDSLEIVKSMAQSQNYFPAICRYYIEISALFISRNKPDSAILSFKKAIRLSEEKKILREGGDAYLGLANLYQFTGNTLDAAQNYLHATKLLKNIGRKRQLISLYRNLNSVLNKLEQKNGALQNITVAIETDKSNETDLVKIINNKTSEEGGLNFPDQTLVREGGRDGIYVIFGNAKFPILDDETLAAYGATRDIQRIPAGSIDFIPDFPRNGSILRELSGDYNVYLVKDSMLYLILSPEVLETYGGWDAVYFTPKGSLKHFPRSEQPVTMENVNTIFNIKQEFDNLSDSIRSALQKNTEFSNELSQKVAVRNKTLEKRKIMLWASAIGVVALLLIVLLLARNFRQKRKEEKLKRKTAIEKERTRIATDMHDDLGAGLSRIKFLSETIGIKQQQHLPIGDDIVKIREYSHEMIDKMGEIVWALNEKNDSLSDLLSYTRSYAAEYMAQNNIACKVSVAENIPEHSLSSEFRRNIYLAVKEALHNIIKHAAATQVYININTGANLHVEISDNGIGYSGINRDFSNGLANMKERMKTIGGTFDIRNYNGTTVTLAAPLPV